MIHCLTAGRRAIGVFLLSGLATFVSSGADRAQAQISVSPVIIQVPVDHQAVTRTISVTNVGAAPASVRFYAGDFDQKEAGEHLFADLGTLSHSCGDRVRVFPDGASLLPGETKSLRVEMEPGVKTCWAAVFIETAGMTEDGTLVRQRIAAKVYGVHPEARVDGEVSRMTMETGDSGRTLVVTFRNTGDAPLRPEGSLEIRSFTGEVVAATPIPAFSALPGRDRSVSIRLPALEQMGEFLAVPILDFGGAYLAGGQLAFEVGKDDVELTGVASVADASQKR